MQGASKVVFMYWYGCFRLAHVDTRIEDTESYTRPFNYAGTWVLGEPDEQIQEYSCRENNVDAAHLRFGPGPIRPDGTRGYLNPAPLPPPVSRAGSERK